MAAIMRYKWGQDTLPYSDTNDKVGRRLKCPANFSSMLSPQLTARMILLALWCSTLLLIAGNVRAQAGDRQPLPAIIPLPVEAVGTNENFSLTAPTVIVCKDSSLGATVALLNLYLQNETGRKCAASMKAPASNYILIAADSINIRQVNGYRLRVADKYVELTAHDAGGIIYGIQTLRQLWIAKHGNLRIPGCLINDYPRFAYRGMGLDVSRHLFPVAFIKKYIDLLSLYKFNAFHWHLTDDQGWRIEIKKYPKLQSLAAWRRETLIGHKKEMPHRFDGKRYGGYYRQNEIKEIVDYATQRNINIIPEVEMPGHALAALSAYPALGCTGGLYQAATFWGVFDDVYCAGNDSSFVFLENVLDEVMQLFPSPYIHIGGDECPKTKWMACPKCQQRIRTLHLKDEHALQGYFIKRIEKYINSKGRNIIGWDEILEGGLAPNATVMSWRGEEGGIAAAQQHHSVVMTPESHLYFDYYQSLYAAEPLAAASYTPLEKVYSYEPAGEHITLNDRPFIRGLEGQAFSEYFFNSEKAEYMIFPRALAVAEIAWTPPARRSYPDFTARLRRQTILLKKLKVHFADTYDEIQFTETTTAAGTLKVVLLSSLPSSAIYYTTDGSIPSLHSKKYSDTVLISRTCTLKATLLGKNEIAVGRIFEQHFIVHKAIGAEVVLQQPPMDKYNPGAMALVNGIDGNTRYNDNQWTGFSGTNFEAVIDLKKPLAIKKITLHILNYHWQRMWAPRLIEIALSDNGKDYKKVFEQNRFPVNGINTIIANLRAVSKRYIKITAVNQGIIPPGSYGAGGKALLMTDEIIVE